jgi:hypothetical protein
MKKWKKWNVLYKSHQGIGLYVLILMSPLLSQYKDILSYNILHLLLQ